MRPHFFRDVASRDQVAEPVPILFVDDQELLTGHGDEREMTSAPQRDDRGACARADEGCDVVAHAREGIAAALPSLILVAFNARAAFLLARDPTTT